MSNINKLRIEDRVRFLNLKYRGNAVEISRESGLPVEYIDKILKRIKREKKNTDVNRHIGETMAQHIMDGSEQRKAYLLQELKKEFEKPEELKSVCCNWFVTEHTWDGEKQYTCRKCGKDCDAYSSDKRDKNLILRLISQLRTEDEAVINFLVKLGFVNKMMNGDFDTPPPIPQSNRKVIESKQLDPTLVEDIDKMDPRTREALRHQLEKRMIDAEQ